MTSEDIKHQLIIIINKNRTILTSTGMRKKYESELTKQTISAGKHYIKNENVNNKNRTSHNSIGKWSNVT